MTDVGSIRFHPQIHIIQFIAPLREILSIWVYGTTLLCSNGQFELKQSQDFKQYVTKK